jgi:hypothetical protein
MFRRFARKIKRNASGQSFIELALVTVILALLLVGVVEFGFLLNNYMHVLDGAREAARSASTQPPFEMDDTGQPIVVGGVIEENWPFYFLAAGKAADTMLPVELDPLNTDDIVINVFSVSGPSIVRFPSANGWSLCQHYADFAYYFLHLKDVWKIPVGLDNPDWTSGCTVRTSQFSSADILGRMDSVAPPTGVLVVEVFYGYPQVLKMPFFTGAELFGTQFSLIPDPIPVYVYTVMPLSAAEPTPTP